MATTPSETKAAWGGVIALALCSFVLVSSEFMPASLLSPMAHDLHLTEGEAGQSISISALAALFTSLSVPRLAGAMDRRLVLLGLTGLTIGSALIVALAPSFGVLMAGRVLLGVAIGGFWSLSAATSMRLVPPASVPKALAIVNGGNAIASTLAAPVGSLIGTLVGWRGAFMCLAPLALIALVWQAISLPQLPSDGGGAKGAYGRLLRKPEVMIGYVGAILFFGGQFWLFTYLRPFLEQVTRVSSAQLSALLLLLGVMGFIGTTLIGRFIGRRLHLLLAVLPAIMMAAAIALALTGSSLIATVPLLAIWGMVGTAAPVAWWTWVTRAAAQEPEVGSGLLVAAAQVGVTAGASLGGLTFDAAGPSATFLASAAILALASLVALCSAPANTLDACREGPVQAG